MNDSVDLLTGDEYPNILLALLAVGVVALIVWGVVYIGLIVSDHLSVVIALKKVEGANKKEPNVFN
jgi:hypothetical protein